MNEITEYFKDINVNFIIDENGVKWVKAIDVARVLGYKNPAVSSNNFISVNKNLLTTCIRKFLIQHITGKKTTWYMNEKGLVAFLVKTNSDKAIEFQKWALNVISKELSITNTNTNSLRIKSKKVRNDFTGVLKEHGISKPYEYIQLTYQTKIYLDIDKNKKKDECNLLELCKISMSELLSAYKIESDNKTGYKEISPVVIESSKTIKQIPIENNSLADII